MDWAGTQVFESTYLGFHWRARLRLGPFMWVNAEDRLDRDGGYGGARLLGILPVGSARGPDVTRSQVVRNLAELVFVPSLASNLGGIVWSPAGEDAFILSAPDVDADAEVRFTVDDAGDVRSARSPDRPREDGQGGFLHEPYRLDFDGHDRLASGVRIPHRSVGTFETAGGDWQYWRFEVVNAE